MSVCRLSLARLVSYCPARALRLHTRVRAQTPWCDCCTWPAGGGNTQLLLQLEGRHCLLRPGAPLLPGCLRVLYPEPQQAQGELPAGLQHRRVSAQRCNVTSLLSFFLCLKLAVAILCLSAGGWPAVPHCWMPMTWFACTSPTGSVCTPTSRSSTAAWWKKAWSKPRRGCRRLLELPVSELSALKNRYTTSHSLFFFSIFYQIKIRNKKK